MVAKNFVCLMIFLILVSFMTKKTLPKLGNKQIYNDKPADYTGKLN